MSKVKVVVEVDSCDKDETAAADPSVAGDIFYMTFTTGEPIKIEDGVRKTWYLNPGNISTESWITWNPMPWAGKLLEMKVTMVPAFKAGQAEWFIMKNSTKLPSTELIIYENQTKGTRTQDLHFTIDDYIGLGLTLDGVPTDTWPAAVLVFQRGVSDG